MNRGAWAIALLSVLVWHTTRAQVVAFGASNVYGWNVEAAEAFPARLEAALRARGYPTRVLNAGMFGNTTAQLRARLDADIPAGTTLVVLDMSGGPNNDSFSGVSRPRGMENLQAITAALQARGIRVIPVDFASVPAQFRQGDGRHLTPEGHEWIAAQLLPQITAALGPAPTAPQEPRSGGLAPLCTDEAHRRCADAGAEDVKQLACMREHRAELSTDCRKAVTIDAAPR